MFCRSRNETLEVSKASFSDKHTHTYSLSPRSSRQLRWLSGSSVAAESLERSQQFVLSGSVRHHVALLLQQDAVQRLLIVNVATHHQYILFPLLQVGAVAHIRDPQELPVLQAEAVPIGVDDLDVVARLLASVQLPEDSGPENKVLLAILSLAFPSTFNSLTFPTMLARWKLRQEVSVVLLPLQAGQDGLVRVLPAVVVGRLTWWFHRP